MRTITRESLTAVAPPVATSGEALVRSADDAHAAGDRPRAIELYERALHMLPSSATGTAATVLRRLGRVHWESGQLDEAIDVLQVALVAATAAGDTSCAAHAQNVLAVCHWQRGQLDEAEWLYRATRTSAVSARDAALVAMIDQNLGIIESVRGNLQSALRHYQSSLAGYRALGHRAHLGRLLSNMGMLYTALTRWDDADRAYDEAAVLCEEVGDAGARTMVEVNRVQLWLARGAVERALVACDRILGSAAAADARVLGETLKLRGIAARETGDHAGADDFLARALASARERQDPLLEAETLREVAEVACQLGRNRDMLRALSQAHHIFAGLRAGRDLADVGERAQRLEQRFHDVVARWSSSIESKDPYTQGHCERVARYACALAERAGFHSITMFWFRVGALLHDVGKIVVPIQILTKPGPLTDEERRIMERHALAGAELLSDVEFPWDVLPIIRNHHERWDGRGYPDQLAGESIPLAARILCIADVYDALTTDRPYRKAFARERALDIMASDKGAFDPELFEEFRSLLVEGEFAELSVSVA
ncbi:MAG: HD domain-containing protein [Gemmatimonadaceae bacterium]|nr:HD domain-containing protein [Gemmatimonadaceae bacterium]NUR18814.1 HD domain-containing protein [Gemmatimonadaceae bacterium]